MPYSPRTATLCTSSTVTQPRSAPAICCSSSGQVGSRPDGSPEPDFEAQVRLAFDNLEATLAAGGCTFDDIVDVTTFHTDPDTQFATIMAVKSDVFAQAPYPNWTAIGVNWLAGFDFEIKVIARVPDNS